MFNNSFRVKDVAEQEDSLAEDTWTKARTRISSEYCLPLRLPSTSVLRREAEQNAPIEELRQLRRTPTPPPSPGEDSAPEDTRPRRPSLQLARSSAEALKRRLSFKSSAKGPWREPLAHEVMRAVEQKDLMFLMEVRDRAFHLLLRKTGDATPLVHAMRIGDSHREVAIVLLGAFSRWVNYLEDEDMESSQTRILLKALRTNLKLAIDYGLQQSQSDLLASFLQTLIMSEGDKWVNGAVSTVTAALRAGNEGKPVATAESTVRTFATRELGKAESIAALEEYVANATGDLVIMGMWSIALDKIPGAAIPSYYFARDDRVFKAFEERLNQHKDKLPQMSRRLRWQIRVVSKVFEGRANSYKRKVELISHEFDIGPGV